MWNPSECGRERGNEDGEKLSGGRAGLRKWRKERGKRERRKDAWEGGRLQWREERNRQILSRVWNTVGESHVQRQKENMYT